MKNLISILIITITISSYSQKLDYNNNNESITLCNALKRNNFSNEKAADNALDKILSVIGASKRFVVQECNNINNAVAISYKGVRYIIYDPKFMNDLSNSNNWANMFILAHEVGHHINGHAVDVILLNNDVVPEISLAAHRTQELEADQFAGFVLGRLGASLSEASIAINNLSTNEDDTFSTHPNKDKRLAAIKKGFNESGGKIDATDLDIEKGKVVDSKYSNIKFANVEYRTLTKYYSDATYVGFVSVNTNEPFGYGNIYRNNGDKYEGELAGGKRNGYGTEYYKDGDVYEGFWTNNYISGKGIYTHISGYKEIGYFSNGKLSGIGTQIFSEGNLEGMFYDGNPIKVTLNVNKDGRKVEFGFLDDSEGNGFSIYTYSDGDTLKANFEHGLLVGNKTMHRTRGNEYKKSTRVVGYDSFIPELYFKDIKIIYVDDMSYDDLHKEYPKNQCPWKIGFGITKSQNGFEYKGYFLEGTIYKAGYGEFTISNVNDYDWPANELVKYDKFIGIYYNDKRNGYGVKYLNGNIVQKGIYKDDEFIKSVDFDFELMQKTFKDFY